MSELFGNSMDLMNKVMDWLWKKQEVIAENIANVDTPGYKAKYVTFEEELKKRLESACRAGGVKDIGETIHDAQYRINTADNESARLDGNGVNTDSELVEMTRTALQYQYAQSAYNGEWTRLRTVIKG